MRFRRSWRCHPDAIVLPTVAGILPGADLFGGFAIAWVIQLVTVAAYLMLSVAMPRSGGDYVWVTRSVHPSIGFMSGWAWAIQGFFIIGFPISYTLQFLVPGTLNLVSYATANTGYTTLGALIATPASVYIIGTMITVVMTALAILGTRWVIRVLTTVGVLGLIAFAAMLGVLLTASQNTISSGFATFANQTTTQIVNDATAAGMTTQPTISATLASVPIWLALVIAGSQYMVYLGGEMKQVKRNMTLAQVLNMVIILIVWSAGILIFVNVVGKQFYTALSYLWFNASPKYTVPGGSLPSPQTFAFIVNPNLALTLFIGIMTILVELFGAALPVFPWVSRVLLAMSFDRMLPAWVSQVSDRWHTPVNALIVTAIASLIGLLAWVQGWAAGVLNLSIILAIIYTIAGIAAIAFPFTKKDVFESSPVKYRIGGIPLLSIFGGITVISWLIVLYVALTNTALGALGVPIYTFAAILFISGIIVYFLVRYYWKFKGLDVSLAFKEIPPE